MTYALFIDDERYPALTPNRDGHYWTMDPALCADRTPSGLHWIIARSLIDVRSTLQLHGAPLHASFDHDLGDQVPSGADIATAMKTADLISRQGPGGFDDILARDFQFRFPEGFTFAIHSMNSVGGPDIAMILNGYLKHLCQERRVASA